MAVILNLFYEYNLTRVTNQCFRHNFKRLVPVMRFFLLTKQYVMNIVCYKRSEEQKLFLLKREYVLTWGRFVHGFSIKNEHFKS